MVFSITRPCPSPFRCRKPPDLSQSRKSRILLLSTAINPVVVPAIAPALPALGPVSVIHPTTCVQEMRRPLSHLSPTTMRLATTHLQLMAQSSANESSSAHALPLSSAPSPAYGPISAYGLPPGYGKPAGYGRPPGYGQTPGYGQAFLYGQAFSYGQVSRSRFAPAYRRPSRSCNSSAHLLFPASAFAQHATATSALEINKTKSTIITKYGSGHSTFRQTSVATRSARLAEAL